MTWDWDACSPRIMGILNVTPDSFSDGGQYPDVDAAVSAGLAMAQAGAHWIDVGGESTRPGAKRVPGEQQRRRVVEVIARLAEQLPSGVGISIDTTLAPVAQAALDAGATLINDVSAGRDDPNLLALAAQRQQPVVLMHMRGEPATMQHQPQYDQVVNEVETFLLERVEAAVSAGVNRSAIWIDPGIGFGKTTQQNVALLAALPRLASHGHPVLLGTSRKRFLEDLAGDVSLLPQDRVAGTCATTAWGVLAGVAMFRVHDVAANRQALQTAWIIKKASEAQKKNR